jgi:hypothetical protein
VAVVDQVLAHMEQQDAFNRMTWDFLFRRAGGRSSRLARWSLELLTVLVLVYAAYRIAIRSRHKIELGVPLLAQVPLVPALRQGGDEGIPVMVADPASEASAVFDQLATAVVELGPARVYRKELTVR